MTLYTHSQITPTKEQKRRIEKLTTPEKLIEYSKGLSNEKRQSKIIDSLQLIIKEKDLELISLIEKHREDILSIARNNNTVIDSNTEIDIIEEKIEKVNFFKKIRMYGSLEFPNFNLNNPEINIDLLYDFKKINLELGVRATSSQYTSNKNNNYSAIIRYNFF